MIEVLQNIVKNIFGDNVILATMFISMLPIIELKGGIPFGMSKEFWGAKALTNWESFWCSYLGSCLVVPILALIFLPLIRWLKTTKPFKKLALKLENSIKSKASKINSDEKETENNQSQLDEKTIDTENKLISENVIETKEAKIKYNKKFFIKLFGVFAFVAIPLPLTGVWTGTAISVMIGIPFGWTCLVVILGNLIAGFIVQTVCAIFPNFTLYLLLIFLLLSLLLLIIGIIKNKIKNKK